MFCLGLLLIVKLAEVQNQAVSTSTRRAWRHQLWFPTINYKIDYREMTGCWSWPWDIRINMKPTWIDSVGQRGSTSILPVCSRLRTFPPVDDQERTGLRLMTSETLCHYNTVYIGQEKLGYVQGYQARVIKDRQEGHPGDVRHQGEV